jgi:urease accessory protein
MSDWLTWQIVDSAFPTGTFAHSWGLEAAWQQGDVDDLPALRAFLDATIRQTARGAIPLVNATYRAPERLALLDALADAFLINAVANSASRVQGRTLLATIARIWPSAAIADLQGRCAGDRSTDARDAGQSDRTHGHENGSGGRSVDGGGRVLFHVAPITGAAFRAIGVPLETVQRAVLFAAARGVTSAAVRLGIAGSYEAQRLLFDCGPLLDRVASRCRDFDEEDLAQTEPILDLLQSAHGRLYSRLFQS